MYAAYAMIQNSHNSAATNTVSCGLTQRADRMKTSDRSCSTVHHLYSSLARAIVVHHIYSGQAFYKASYAAARHCCSLWKWLWICRSTVLICACCCL